VNAPSRQEWIAGLLAVRTARRRRALLAAADAAALVVTFALGYGLHVATTPEPKPVIRTVVTDMPPCVADLIEAARAERTHREVADQHATLAAARAAERYEAELSRDDGTIAKAAQALDTENRIVQQADLDAASAAVAFDEAAEDCEADR